MRMNLIRIQVGKALATNAHNMVFMQVVSTYKGMISMIYALRQMKELLEAEQRVIGDPIARRAPCSWATFRSYLIMLAEVGLVK